MAENQEIINATRDFVPRCDVVRVNGIAIGTVVVKHYNATVDAYAQEVVEARTLALKRMNKHAAETGANGVVGIRFDSSIINSTHNIDHTVEYTAYGTAVRLRPEV